MDLNFKSNQIVCAVYSITNIVNNMTYIGCSKNVYKRISEHKYKTKTGNTLLYKGLREYGLESFQVKILEECTLEEKNDKEIHWIGKMNTKHPNGYNMTEGGIGQRGLSMSLEAKMKQKATSLRKWPDPTKDYRGRGETHYMFGKHHTESTKAKIGMKARMRNEENPNQKRSEETKQKIKKYFKTHRHVNSKRVDMLDKNTLKKLLCFYNMASAAHQMRGGITRKEATGSKISEVCSGKRSTAYGYKWQYNNEGNEQNEK